MANIRDCAGQYIKINKNSITIKTKEGKTCGVVKNVTPLLNMQPNKQIVYFKQIKIAGLHGKISLSNYVVVDNVLYLFRDMKSEIFHNKYGYFSEEEERNAKETLSYYNLAKEVGIEIIDCIYL